MGVTVTVDVVVGDRVGIGVSVEIAITLFPILQLARTKENHRRNKNLFATIITLMIALFTLEYPCAQLLMGGQKLIH